MKLSDLIASTFGISAAEWTVDGVTRSKGTWDRDPRYNLPPSQCGDWKAHTAAEMGPSRIDNPVAFVIVKQKFTNSKGSRRDRTIGGVFK